MAVIVRETREIGGQDREIKVFKTDEPLTQDTKEQAEQLDELLQEEMQEIIKTLEENDLLDDVGGRDTLELWYTVGTYLDFVDRTELISSKDREHVWRALYDHAGPLHRNEKIPERVKRSPRNSHFYYCYLLGKFDWETVQSGGTWTTWVEIFDSKPIRQDERIVDWLVDVIAEHEGPIQDWARELNKGIRNEFKNKDTTVFDDTELRDRLDQVFKKTHGT